MRLYVDENSASKELVARLTSDDHEVVEVLRGADDLAVWGHAQGQEAAVVTENAVDFVPLAEHSPDHWGLLLIYRENDRERDMTAAAIERAIGRVDGAYPDGIRGQILVLNAYRG